MNFLALDVETANPDLSSICQIGIITFVDGEPRNAWSSLINPLDYFDTTNMHIHGITPQDVRRAPTWKHVAEQVRAITADQTVVTHGSFDRTALTRVCAKHDTPPLNCRWLDTCMVVRRTWEEVAYSGYGLAAMAHRLGITFNHHDAAEDATATGRVLVRAMLQSGKTLEQWLERVRQPISAGGVHHTSTAHHATAGNPDGPLSGNTIVFTGALSMPRWEAAQHAANAGCDVADSVTKHTTLLVVGDQDVARLAGHEKSNKHRKAEAIIAKGAALRILCESDFLALINQD